MDEYDSEPNAKDYRIQDFQGVNMAAGSSENGQKSYRRQYQNGI